jgi:hypothetical protein
MRAGRRLAPAPPVKQIRERTLANLACLPKASKALRGAPVYPVEKSAELERLLEDIRVQHFGAVESSNQEGGL